MMSSSPAEIEREADATRARLASTLDDLRGNLAPQHLVDEIFERVAGPKGSSIVKNVESVIRENPLPMMLMGIGTAMWLGSGWRKVMGNGVGSHLAAMGLSPGSVATPAAEHRHNLGAAETLKENVASVGHSIADTAYQVLRSHASAKLDQYSKMASDGVNTASEQIVSAVEQQIDKTVGSISASMQKRPLAFSAIALAIGAALGGAALVSDKR